MSEVHFCNLCDQSVPLVEIQDGAATQVENRVLCRQCRALLARAGGGGRGLGTALALVLALLAVAGVAYLWHEQGQRRTEDTRQAAGQFAGLREDFSRLGVELRGRADQESNERSRIGGEVSTLRQELAQARSEEQQRSQGLQQAVDDLAPLIEQAQAQQARLDTLAAGQTALEDHDRAAQAAFESLREQVSAMTEQVQNQAAAVEQQKAAASTSYPPEVAAALRVLQSEDGRVRYAALEKLEKVQDARLLPQIYPLLSDPYEFVRFLAASLLGDWNVREAAPHLIEALLDDKNFVRDAAARSLRRITAQNIPYDKDAPEPERQQAYMAWKTWWEENGAAFLKAA